MKAYKSMEAYTFFVGQIYTIGCRNFFFFFCQGEFFLSYVFIFYLIF